MHPTIELGALLLCCRDQRIRKVMCKHILYVLLTSFNVPVEHPLFARKGRGAHIQDAELKNMFAHLKAKEG